MALNLVNNESYEFVPEKVGTFIPNFTPTDSSYLNVKQVGNIVYLSGILAVDGSLADIGSHLGDITGVDPPVTGSHIPVISYSENVEDLHNGFLLMVSWGIKEGTYIGKSLTGTDKAFLIDGFYFTA